MVLGNNTHYNCCRCCNSSYFEKTQSFFYDILQGKDLKSIISLLSIYVLFIIMLIFIGMMSSFESRYHNLKKQKFSDYLIVFMIAGYGIILMMPAINILGIVDDTSNFTDNQQYTYFMLLIGLYIVMFIFSFIKFKSKYFLGKQNYLYVYVPILILVTVFVDFSSAMWRFQLSNSEKIVDPERASRLIEFIAIFPLYAIFYSAPRFVLLRKSYNLLPILSAMFSTAYFVWKSLDYIEL